MLIVILVFLQDWRAMLVPATTVPVTIIGAFAAMAALGFTVNLSTLFAIVLSIGIVVDDAIVVVEGAAHNIEKGMSGHDAAIRAMDELFAPIIGITLVLMSVFLPAAFLPGLTGRMYAQFALVIAATALLSADQRGDVEADPMCAVAAPARAAGAAQLRSIAASMRSMTASSSGYAGLIGAHGRARKRRCDRRSSDRVGGLRLFAGRQPASCRSRTRATCLSACSCLTAPPLERTQRVLDQVTRSPARRPASKKSSPSPAFRCSTTVRPSPMPASPISFSRNGASAVPARICVRCWSLNASLAAIEEANTLVFPPPPIQGIGNAAGSTMQIELRDGSFDLGKLQAITGAIVANAQTQCASAARQFAVPLRRAAIQHRRRPCEDRDPSRYRRPGVLGARRLSRLELR